MKTPSKTKTQSKSIPAVKSKVSEISDAADMAQLAETAKCCGKMKRLHHHKGSSCMVYCLGVIGAAIYFMGNAVGFWMNVLALLKALVWPVYVVKGLLKFLGI